MAGKLYLIAARGTDNLSGSIDTREQSLDKLLNAMDTVDDASRLLRGAGLLTLHEKAGYVPSNDPRTLEKAIPADNEHHQKDFPHKVLEFLNIIYWGDYSAVYPEWLHWLALHDVTFPYEALPLMLNLASNMPSTQALTKRIIGSRGRWLIEQSKNRGWYWAKHIKPARRPRLTKFAKKESRILAILEKYRYRRLPIEVSYELRLMNFPWGIRFSKVIADTLETMFSQQESMQSDDLARIADIIQWHIHPVVRETIVAGFRKYNQQEETQTIARKLDNLLSFRASMRAIFDTFEA